MFMNRILGVIFCASLLLITVPVQAQVGDGNINFADRKAVIINNSPYVKLEGFAFKNEYRDRRFRLVTDLGWRNTGDKPIVAFEVVTMRYDPFNRPLSGGGRWLVPGTNSGNWAPLAPGASSKDGLIGFDSENVYTAVAFVRAVRLSDGTVWYFNEAQVRSEITKALPTLKEVGDINPAVAKKE
jgi:hypothetical protein